MSSSDLRPSVAWFADRMESQLRAEDNCHCAWETEYIRDLVEAAFDLWQDLAKSVRGYIVSGDPAEEVIMDAAALANIAMAIACQVDPIMAAKRRGQ